MEYNEIMKITQLQYFVEVVRTNNITKAAKKLYVSQPAISTAIRELEKEFNINLFIRYNNQLTLTDEGHYLYNQAQNFLKLYEKMKDDISSLSKTAEIVKIGVPPMMGSFLVPPMIDEFTKLHPNAEFQLSELGSIANKKAILEKEVALGFTIKQENEEWPEELNYIKIDDTTLLFVANKNNPLSKKELIDIEDIKNAPLVLMKEDSLQSKLIQKAFHDKGIKPNIKLRTNQLYTIQELLNRNNLCGFIFNQLIKDNDNLIGIPLKEPIKLELVITWRKNAVFNEITTEFLNFIIKNYNKID